MTPPTEDKRKINVPISFDFSFSAVEYIMNYAKENNLGNYVSMGYRKMKSFDEWWIEFEYAVVISEGID